MALQISNIRFDGGSGSIRIQSGRITHLGDVLPASRNEIDGEGCWLLPGLINAHDHLALNLLPPLGSPPYTNSAEWGRDVYRPDCSPMREIWKLNRRERLFWGAYRNLLSGVTTVQHHDRGHWQLNQLPVRVPAYRWRHCPGSPLGGWYGRPWGAPLFIHCAEGTDAASRAGVGMLQAQGLLGPKTVLIHGIALTPEDIRVLAATGTGLVVCPASNQFLFGCTAPVQALLDAGVPLALGTDSTASGGTDLLAELQQLRGQIPNAALIDMVTTGAARLLGVPDRGQLQVGFDADLLLVHSPRARSVAEVLLNARNEDIRLVMLRGSPVLVRSPFTVRTTQLRAVRVNGEQTWLAGPIDALLERTRRLLKDRLFFGHHIEPN